MVYEIIRASPIFESKQKLFNEPVNFLIYSSKTLGPKNKRTIDISNCDRVRNWTVYLMNEAWRSRGIIIESRS